MPDYRKMYAVLCGAIDDAIEPLEKIPEAAQIAQALQNALYEAEEIYIDTSPYDVNPCRIIELNAGSPHP